MASVYLIQVAILAVHIINGAVIVKANADFCGGVFETQVGK